MDMHAKFWDSVDCSEEDPPSAWMPDVIHITMWFGSAMEF